MGSTVPHNFIQQVEETALLTDPQTINAVALPRISVTETGALYRSADNTMLFKLSHVYGRRNKHSIRYEHSKIAIDVLTAANQSVGMTVSVNIDVPPQGYTVAEASAKVIEVADWLKANSGANLARLLGGES